jgi:16S rRNA (adenine1518-N6/adenine1519-N6)-dimethyltransferase
VTSGGPAGVGGLLERLGVRPSKRLGQSFLADPNVIAAVIDAIGADACGRLVEIGPGLGALTNPLAERAAELVAVEIDRRLAARLQESLAGRVSIVEQDILEFDFAAHAARSGGRLVVVGSIPYSITAPILKRLIDERAAIQAAYLITQREVAEKILASPGKDGTAMGIFVRAHADVHVLRKIPRGAFFPVPDVDSTMWRLTMRATPRFASSEASFFAVVRAVYGARRKTLRNALQRAYSAHAVDAMLARSRIDPRIRGETLGFAELDALAEAAETMPPAGELSVDREG